MVLAAALQISQQVGAYSVIHLNKLNRPSTLPLRGSDVLKVGCVGEVKRKKYE